MILGVVKLRSNRMLVCTFALGNYYVFNGTEMPSELTWENTKDLCWIVLNHIPNNRQSILEKEGRYKISSGDIIRFGNVVFKVTVLCSPLASSHKKTRSMLISEVSSSWKPNQPTENESLESICRNGYSPDATRMKRQFDIGKADRGFSDWTVPADKNAGDQSTERKFNQLGDESWDDPVCRICYGKEEDAEDPLVQPWRCTGSMRFIHLSWAKDWIEEELLQDINENVRSYWWERITWELWSSKFNDVLSIDGVQHSLFQRDKLTPNTYLMLESINPEDMKIKFCLLVDNPNKRKVFNVGRNTKWDVKINLDSISRSHAKIIYEKGEFFLKDLDSTFGTLVLLKQPLVFTKSQKEEACLQAGSTLIEIKYGASK